MTILSIDRTIPFNFATWNWTLEGVSIAEEDERATCLKKVDLSQVRLESGLEDGEDYLDAEKKLERLKKHGYIRMDFAVFHALLENQQIIPSNWKKRIDGCVTEICFDGTILLLPNGRRATFCLCWVEGEWSWRNLWPTGRWSWRLMYLAGNERFRGKSTPSPVLMN